MSETEIPGRCFQDGTILLLRCGSERALAILDCYRLKFEAEESQGDTLTLDV